MTIATLTHYLKIHNFPSQGLHISPYQGVACQTWLTNTHAIKINSSTEYQSDIYTESVATPALTNSGINTPNLIHFDDSQTHFPEIIAIFTRAPGIPLANTVHLEPQTFYIQLGKQLKILHSLPPIPDPNNILDPPWILDYNEIKSKAPLTPNQIPKAAPHCLCHQDLHAENLLVHNAALSAIIDWGDAGYADPACDFRYIPPRYLPYALQGYGNSTPQLRLAITWHHIDQFLYVQEEQKQYGPHADFSWEEIAQEIRQLP